MITVKRVIGILIVATIFFGAGTIFAKGDSATKLSNWYSDLFQKESEEIETIIASGIRTSYIQAGTFLLESKNHFDSSIKNFRDNQITEVEVGIKKYLDHTKNRILEKVADLNEENFDDYLETVKIDEEIEGDVEEILKEVIEE